MHGWSPVVVLGTANTTDAHDHHIKIIIQTHCFPFLKMWLQVNPWEIPVTANRENRETLQVVWSYELYIKNVYIFSFVQGAEMKLQIHFGTAVPVLSAPLQLPRGAPSSSVSSCILPHCEECPLPEGNNFSHLKQCPILQRQIQKQVRVLPQPLKSFWHL